MLLHSLGHDTDTHTHTPARARISISISASISIFTVIFMYIFICIFMFIFIYTCSYLSILTPTPDSFNEASGIPAPTPSHPPASAVPLRWVQNPRDRYHLSTHKSQSESVIGGCLERESSWLCLAWHSRWSQGWMSGGAILVTDAGLELDVAKVLSTSRTVVARNRGLGLSMGAVGNSHRIGRGMPDDQVWNG